MSFVVKYLIIALALVIIVSIMRVFEEAQHGYGTDDSYDHARYAPDAGVYGPCCRACGRQTSC